MRRRLRWPGRFFRAWTLLLLGLTLVACTAASLREADNASFTAAQRQNLLMAQQLAQRALFDPWFVATLGSLQLQDFLCAPCRDGSAPRPTGSAILAGLQQRGMFAADNIRAKQSPWGATMPLAVTDPCDDRTWLNVDQLNREPVSIANTLVHERVHSLCYVHAQPTRDAAYCDPAYVVGDLAEVVLRARAAQARGILQSEPIYGASRICPSLCRALAVNGVPYPAAQCRP